MLKNRHKQFNNQFHLEYLCRTQDNGKAASSLKQKFNKIPLLENFHCLKIKSIR
jgi:hypothetical protein